MAESNEIECDWCHTTIVGVGRAPRLYMLSLLRMPSADYRQSWRICNACHDALRRLISKRGRSKRNPRPEKAWGALERDEQGVWRVALANKASTEAAGMTHADVEGKSVAEIAEMLGEPESRRARLAALDELPIGEPQDWPPSFGLNAKTGERVWHVQRWTRVSETRIEVYVRFVPPPDPG
jgi:hypothetical protein